MAELTDKGGPRFESGGFHRKSAAKAGFALRRIQKDPETISDLGAGVPNHSELEPSGGDSNRLGGASEVGGMKEPSSGGGIQTPPFSTMNLLLPRT